MFAEHGSLKSLLVKEGQEITIHPYDSLFGMQICSRSRQVTMVVILNNISACALNGHPTCITIVFQITWQAHKLTQKGDFE